MYAAYKAAVDRSSPTVILAKTVKGYGLGEAGEGRNVTHQQKKLNERELREFRTCFDIPLADEEVVETPSTVHPWIVRKQRMSWNAETSSADSFRNARSRRRR